MSSNVNPYNINPYNEKLLNGGLVQSSQNPDDNIVFNDFGLQNAQYCTRYIRHESAPDRNFIVSDVPRNHGKNLQDAFFKKKIITLVGTLVAGSNSELLAQMDLCKKFLSANNSELKIIEGTTTRVYTASCTSLGRIFADRDHYMRDWINYEIQFTCWLPFGRDYTRTKRDDFGKTSATIDIELTNSGTTQNRLIAYISFDTADTVSKINWKNNTNSEEIEIEQAFSASDILLIDGENTKITANGANVDFSGFPPSLNIGANSLTLTITSTSHTVSISNKFYNYFL